MNAVTKIRADALRHPSARLTQHLRLWIGTLDLPLDVLKFKVRAGFCKDYSVDVTVTSPRLDITGELCVGWRAGLQIDERVWFFHPLAFIRHFRKCGWLSQKELTHLLPRNVVQKATPFKWQQVHISSAAPMLAMHNQNAIQRRLALNNAIRKYGIHSPVRMASFIANAAEETQWFKKYHEGSPFWYAPWDGRGMLQLTHATNYIKYWRFRGIAVSQAVEDNLKHYTELADHNRTLLPNGRKGMNDPTHSLRDANTHISADFIEKREAVVNPFEAADSAGCYWVWSGSASCADEYWGNQSSTLNPLVTDHGAKYFYINSAFGKVAATVNTGKPNANYNVVWDKESRFLAFANAQVILFDVTSFLQPDGSKSLYPIGFGRVEEQ